MRTIEYLFGPPELAALFWPAVVVGLLVSVLCAVLSPLVVLRRMSFIGQGVSHAAFAGVGLAMVLGLGAGTGGDWGVLVVVALACVVSAVGIAALSDRKGLNADTAIGIVLVTAMALGFVMIQHAAEAMRARDEAPGFGVESVLFGSVLGVRWGDVVAAGVVVAVELSLLWWFRRGLLFWAFDEVGAVSVGVRTGLVRTLLLVMLALAIVVTMRLAGVVLATALLVLPGATALRCSSRLWPVFGISAVAGVAGVSIGLVVSFELDWQPGPAIVLTQVAGYVAVRAFGAVARSG
ncbi:MAG: metal ABC transporter permease [Phycisphaerales bacterium JB054]